MTSPSFASPDPTAGRGLAAGLWTAQTLLCLAFVAFGAMKLSMPVERLAAMWVWPGQVPEWFLRLIGLIDAAGGIGMLLPSLTRIRPRVTVLAAVCSGLLQVAAILFHLSRGEAAAVPLNVVLLALAVFVAWGRATQVIVTARALA